MIWTSELRHRLFKELGTIPEIWHLAINQGQMEHREDAAFSRTNPSVRFPALLITPLGEEAIEKDKENTKYRLTVLCKLYIYDSRRANSIAPTDHIEAWDKALTIVKKLLQQARTPGYSSIVGSTASWRRALPSGQLPSPERAGKRGVKQW